MKSIGLRILLEKGENVIFLWRIFFYYYDYKNNSLGKTCFLKIFYLSQIIILCWKKSPGILQIKILTKFFILQISDSASAEENYFLRALIKEFISDLTAKPIQSSIEAAEIISFLDIRWPHQWRGSNAQNWKTGGARFKPRSRLST